ncbi:MAG: DUF3466 family protein [Acidobacteriia bacterium]|nr:DUF3466 family protein [Terriglobia bacterium]
MKSLRTLMIAALLLLGLVLLGVPATPAQSVPDIPQAHVTFTTIDVPGAASTNVYGINSAGHITGNYSEQASSPARGFSLADGVFSFFDYPGGDASGGVGINDSDVIAGAASINNFTGIVSFLYDGKNFKTIQVSGQQLTWAYGLNNANTVVGGYGTGNLQAFVFVEDHFRAISPPGEFFSVVASGINNLNQIVGSADGVGFLYDHGKFKKIVVPGASFTAPLGINDQGIIVGGYEKGPPYANHGFILKHGHFLFLDYPGAIATFADGINSAGQIVGSYQSGDTTYHGFVTSPITDADFR